MTEVLAERYELGAPLGSGGMARVVEGYDRLLGRRVAVKLLRPELAADAAVRERLLREARAAASLSHPSAVAVYDTGSERGTPFIVMELVEGGTLAEELEGGPLEPARAVAVAEAVADALAAAHRMGLVHRDVKPGNILLPRAGGVKLADFGIAKGAQEASASLTATGQVFGTPKYVSPEQVAGEPVTPASDVYGLGVVLYEMLAGEPPFAGDNPIAVALAHQSRPVPELRSRRPEVPQELAEVVRRALDKDPARRYADAATLRAALRRVAATIAGAPPPAPAGTAGLRERATARAGSARKAPASREGQRLRASWLVAAALAAMLGVAGYAALPLLPLAPPQDEADTTPPPAGETPDPAPDDQPTVPAEPAPEQGQEAPQAEAEPEPQPEAEPTEPTPDADDRDEDGDGPATGEDAATPEATPGA